MFVRNDKVIYVWKIIGLVDTSPLERPQHEGYRKLQIQNWVHQKYFTIQGK